MNQSYFENRVDRYVLFKKSTSLSEYLIRLTENLKHLYFELGKTHSNQAKRSSPELIDSDPKSSEFDLNDPKYVYIYPCIQMGKHGIDQDLKFAQKIFAKLPSFMDMNSMPIICTSYLNFTNWFREMILKSKINWKILTSSPESNSFYNSKGLSAYVPKLYQYNLHSLFHDSSKHGNNVQAYEYDSKDSTFHAKGEINIY